MTVNTDILHPNQYNTDVKISKQPKSNFDNDIIKNIGTDYSYKHQVVWKNAIGFFILHLLGIWGHLIVFTGGIYWQTFMWSKFLMNIFYFYFLHDVVIIKMNIKVAK